MSLLCAIFGHKQVSDNTSGGSEYATDVRGPVVDGIGRQHFDLYVPCPRCHERYLACRIHGHWITNLMETRI